MKKIKSILICLVFGLAMIISCKKDPVAPTLTTNDVSNITINSVTTGGDITNGGGADVTARGVCWDTSSDPSVSGSHTTDGKGVGSFISNLTDLTPNTLYHIRAYATNKAGTAYGKDISFTTTAIVVPTLTTTAVTSITLNSAVTGGNITADGNAPITEKGVCWSATADPTTANSKTVDGTGSGSFISNISGLSPNTTYHLRAYATNSAGTAYGNDLSFTTNSIAVPTLTTTAVSSISLTSAVSGGNISADGGGTVTSRGVCWSTTANPTITNSKTSDGTGLGTFISSMTGLLPQTLYHVRAYATNTAGTAYGNDVTFTTSAVGVPTLTTNSVTSITQTTAVSGGNITSDGGASVTARGTCWATTTNPTISNSKTSDATGSGSFISNLSGLLPGTTYYVRAYATNSAGTSYGNEVSFTAGQIIIPTLTTTAISTITTTTAVSGGNVLSAGGGTVTGRGICWATTASPTISNFVTNEGPGLGTFVSNLTGLVPGTIYYVRAYAVNSAGTAYGNELSFTAQVALPTLTTTAATAITQTTAVSGGNISNAGGGSITARGTCWSTTANPTTTNSKTSDATGTGNFVSNLTALLPGTTYHIRAYATNSAGTSYGSDLTFTTLVALPTLTTAAVTSITQTSAVSGGDITSAGGGTVSERGVCWALTANPTITSSKTSNGTGIGTYTSNITGLTSGIVYHVRAYATNSAGTAYGNDISFTTGTASLATLTTTVISSIGLTTATSGGNITSDGNRSITARGVCWSTTPGADINDPKTSNSTGTGSFISNITGLSQGTIYYVRAYATNSAGTAYGNEISFNTLLADVDGNTYNVVKIGTQIWMAENLKTTKYRNGNVIGTTSTATLDITTEITPKYEWAYNGDDGLIETYGRLYTWFAATDNRNVCPTGWHVPEDPEWAILEVFLGDEAFAGGKLKETGTTHWQAPNTGATNVTGFTALPGGYRSIAGDFADMGINSYHWSTTLESTGFGWGQGMSSSASSFVSHSWAVNDGASIRCIKD